MQTNLYRLRKMYVNLLVKLLKGILYNILQFVMNDTFILQL